VVAELVRDGFAESFHHGVLAVVDQHGSTLLERGNPDAIVYPRSTETSAGAGGPGHRDRAVTSQLDPHHSEPLRVRSASRRHSSPPRGVWTRRIGAPVSPKDWPLGNTERAQYLAEGHEASALAMNCSGKHAGFLAACTHAGFGHRGLPEL
jgi:L-asparaginase II